MLVDCCGGLGGRLGRFKHPAGRGQLGQSEVKHLDVPALRDKYIGGFDIAMNDALGVGRIERVGHLDAQRQNRLDLHRPASNAMLQRQSVQKLHGDKRVAMLVVNFVDRADVGMIECGGRLGFALKAAERLGIFRDVVRQKLESNKPAQLQVLGLVHHTHTTAAELL